MPEIRETPVTGLPGRTPRENIEKPLTGGREIEPVALIDVSSSNDETVEPTVAMTKKELIKSFLPLFVGALEGDDSQAAHEESGGGLRAFAFSDRGRAQDLGDLNSARIQDQLGQIVWGGETYIMDAVRMAEKAFQDEFGDRALRSRPAQEMLIITDGKLTDPDPFEQWVKQADETLVVAVAVIGSGPGHDMAVQHYQQIARQNRYVTVDALTGVSDPTEVAFDLRLLSGTSSK